MELFLLIFLFIMNFIGICIGGENISDWMDGSSWLGESHGAFIILLCLELIMMVGVVVFGISIVRLVTGV